MITLIASGGLGNQLFQYAAVRAQALRLGVEMEIDTRFYSSPFQLVDSKSFKLHCFPIQAKIRVYPRKGICSAHSVTRRPYRKIAERKKYVEPALGFDEKFSSSIKDGAYISGMFQSYLYFQDYFSEIQRELDLSWACKGLRVPDIDPEKFISVHIRRGDYVNDDNFRMRGALEYYSEALRRFRNFETSAKFLIFSDDEAWCRGQRLFQEKDILFAPETKHDLVHMYLMGKCKGHIIANSSFSLWAALQGSKGQKTTIAPSRWIYGMDTSKLHFLPPRWHVI